MIRLRREGKEGSPEWAEALIRVNALKAQVPVPPGAELHRPTDVILGAPGAPVISRAPSPEVATHYMHKETWQGPPVGMTEREIITSKQYVQVPTNRIQALSQGRVVKGLLDTVEDIIQRRVDLFPPKTGKTMKDAAALAQATAYFNIPGVQNWDPDVARLSGLATTLPAMIKAFGDTANVAVKEREIAQESAGLRPAMQDASFARVDLIRKLINDSTSTAGFPPFPSMRGARGTGPSAPASSAPERWERGPDGKLRRVK